MKMLSPVGGQIIEYTQTVLKGISVSRWTTSTSVKTIDRQGDRYRDTCLAAKILKDIDCYSSSFCEPIMEITLMVRLPRRCARFYLVY